MIPLLTFRKPPATFCRLQAGWAPATRMNDNTEILPLARTAREVSRFLEVSYGIYRGDPHWVAPLLMDLKKVFTDDNPLFQHAEMALWVASRNGRDVGRIAGILDHHHNQAQNDAPTTRR